MHRQELKVFIDEFYLYTYVKTYINHVIKPAADYPHKKRLKKAILHKDDETNQLTHQRRCFFRNIFLLKFPKIYEDKGKLENICLSQSLTDNFR